MRRARAAQTRRLGPFSRGLVVAALALGVLLAGCSSVHDSLGTVDGSCFLALPAASNAVHHHGKLLGARLVSVDALRRHDPVIYQTAATLRGPKVRRVCLVAFSGTFAASSVERPKGLDHGRVAVAVIEFPKSRLLGTVVLPRPPDRFGHPVLGSH